MFGKTDPARYIAALGAGLTLLSAFGVALTEGKIQAIIAFATVAIPLIAGEITRANVYSPASAQLALNLPAGSDVHLLNKAIETGITVQPGDSKAEVREKIAEAANK